MSEPTSSETRPSGRHPVNVGHLVMGLALLGLFGIWALVQGDVVAGREIRWLLPVPWVLAGIAGLTVTAVTGSRRHTTRQTGWVGAGTATGPVASTAPSDAHPIADAEETR
jgi:hypothetical protein